MPDDYDGEGVVTGRPVSDHRRRIRNLLLFVKRKGTPKQIPGSDQDGLLLGLPQDLSTKKKGFTAAALRGLGCKTSSVQVSAPTTTVIAASTAVRSSADWQGKRSRSRRKNNKGKKKERERERERGRERERLPTLPVRRNQTAAVVSASDIWCSPGMGFSGADASVDWVAPSFRQHPSQSRGRVAEAAAAERIEREQDLYPGTRDGSQEQLTSLFDSPDFHFDVPHFGIDLVQPRHLQRARRIRRSPGGLDEIMMFQGRMMLVEMDMHDRYSDWRLDVDNMSYEELLELGDRIGYVNTGLREEEIHRCLRKTKPSVFNTSPIHFSAEQEGKCSICQEEYDVNDEVGKLDCGHSYHIYCIKQWLLRKNACPVCKAPVGKR